MESERKKMRNREIDNQRKLKKKLKIEKTFSENKEK